MKKLAICVALLLPLPLFLAMAKGGDQANETETIKKYVRLEAPLIECDPARLEEIMLDWHTSFNLAPLQLAGVMRNLRVENSNLAGKNALRVLELSRPSVSNLHKSGNLTTIAVGNIIRLNIAAVKK